MCQYRLRRRFTESRAGLLQARNLRIDGVGPRMNAVVDRRLAGVGVVGDLLAKFCRPALAHACPLLAEEPSDF